MESNSSSIEQGMSLKDVNLGVTLFEPNDDKIITREGDDENTLVIFGSEVVIEGQMAQGEPQVQIPVAEYDEKTKKAIQDRAKKSEKEQVQKERE